MKVDWLIVGAGYTGCVLAERIATQLNKKVLIVDRRRQIGGNAYDYFDEHGILVHKYGPHIFHTNSKKVLEYLSQFTEWTPYSHQVLAEVEGKKIPVPFNLNSLHMTFPKKSAERLESLLVQTYGPETKVPILKLRENSNPDLKELADYIYKNVFYGYTLKQWELKPEELDASVTGRVPVFISRDNRYFQDIHQAMPKAGYSEMFKKMTRHENIQIVLNKDYRQVLSEVIFNRMVYTGPIDSFFDSIHGDLPYRSLRFELVNHNMERYQEVGQMNYPNDHLYTRITEFKHLTSQKAQTTTVAVEYPEPYVKSKNEPYYPIPKEEFRKQYAKYLTEADKLNGSVVFAGRLADYQYYNMDQAVARALSVFSKFIGT